MADRKISEMTLLAQGDLVSTTDYVPIVDPSEGVAANRNKRILGSSLVLGSLAQATSVTIGGTLSETISSVVYPVASQFDIGTAPNQIPLNQYLGTMAWQDAAGVNMTGVMALLAGAVGTPSLSFSGDSNTGFWSPAADTVAVSTGGVERLRVDSSGNIGFGTTSPLTFGYNRALCISDPTSASLSLTSGSNGFFIALTSGVSPSLNATNNQPLLFATGGSERMRLDAAGNLGLGVTPSGVYTLQTQLNYTSGFKGFSLGGLAGGSSQSSYPVVGYNVRLTNTADSYQYNAPDWANIIAFKSGQFQFFTAPSGTAGTAITFTQAMTLDASGNLGVGATTFGTSAAKVLSIGSGTEPSTGPADTVQFFSVDRSAGNTIPGIRCEGTGVTDAGITDTTVTNKIAIKVNGTIYYLLATTNAT